MQKLRRIEAKELRQGLNLLPSSYGEWEKLQNRYGDVYGDVYRPI